MIRVTIEMVPLATGPARHMATIEIANDIAESIETAGRRGSYFARFSRISQRGEHLDNYDRIGRVTGISRTTSGAVYRILHGVLADFLRQTPGISQKEAQLYVAPVGTEPDEPGWDLVGVVDELHGSALDYLTGP